MPYPTLDSLPLVDIGDVGDVRESSHSFLILHQVSAGNLSGMSDAMMIGTQEDQVRPDLFPTIFDRHEMMNVTRSFVPLTESAFLDIAKSHANGYRAFYSALAIKFSVPWCLSIGQTSATCTTKSHLTACRLMSLERFLTVGASIFIVGLTSAITWAGAKICLLSRVEFPWSALEDVSAVVAREFEQFEAGHVSCLTVC